ncbi:hypothetical protein CASFOL_011843 [Castilleja foliolosa]|uniref:SWIM-type domain-containing protein n=1 Tax=Castilleja foliolosa TaxID=1961234 RepID=A0ABD3DNR7_9LAMI
MGVNVPTNLNLFFFETDLVCKNRSFFNRFSLISFQKKDKDDHRQKFSPAPVGKREPPPRPTKMSFSRDILLHHGGCWEGLDYTGGERELITVDFGPECFDELYSTVIECTAPIPNDCMVLLHSLQDEGDGTVCKKMIRKASDMNYIFSQTSNVQRHSIFVTINKKGNVGGETSSRDHQVRQPAFDARTFGNVTHDPHVRQQAFDDRTFARDLHVRQQAFPRDPNVRQQSFDDRTFARDTHVPQQQAFEDSYNDWGSHSARSFPEAYGGPVRQLVDVVDARGFVFEAFEMFVDSYGAKEDILNKSLTIFDRRRLNWRAHDTISSSRQNNTNAPAYPAWRIPGSQFDLPEDTEMIKEKTLLNVGDTFDCKKDLIDAVGVYRLQNRGSCRVVYSDTGRFKLVCSINGCEFKVRARGNCDLWTLNGLHPHTCQNDPRYNNYCRVPSKVVASHFAPRLLQENSKLTPRAMMNEFRDAYSIDINYDLALRAKHQAYSLMYGTEKTSFSTLPSYLYMLRKTNPGTVTAVNVDDETGQFHNAFFALGPAIKGFRENARPVIVVDGTFLTGKYKGILFVAVAQDGNNQIFPLAAGIGHVENDETWTWFLRNLERAYGSPDDLLIISDGAKSISNAIERAFPRAKHGLCVVHIARNLKIYGKDACKLFFQAANSCDPSVFAAKLKRLNNVSPGAYQHVLKLGPKRWARSCCDVRRYDFMTSNAAESFNNRIRWARSLPVTSVFEILRSISERWFYERNQAAMAREHELTEAVEKILGEVIENGAKLTAENLSAHKFTVKDRFNNHVVDMSENSCTCREFEIMSIPCMHAAAAARKMGKTLHAYVDDYYRMTALREMWADMVMPLPNPSTWEIPDGVSSLKCIPPDNPRQAGRPKTSRQSAVPEGASSSRRKKQACKRCGSDEHNRAKCKVYMDLLDAEPPEPAESDHDLPESSVNVRKRAPRRCSVCKSTEHLKNKCPNKPPEPQLFDYSD